VRQRLTTATITRQSISHDTRTVVPGQPSGADGSGDGRKTDVKPTALKQEDLSIQITTVHSRAKSADWAQVILRKNGSRLNSGGSAVAPTLLR
jgi:hypothetical protein